MKHDRLSKQRGAGIVSCPAKSEGRSAPSGGFLRHDIRRCNKHLRRD